MNRSRVRRRWPSGKGQRAFPPRSSALRELGGPDWFNLGDGDLALHVARLAGLIDGLVIDSGDADEAPDVRTLATDRLMRDDGDKVRVAQAALALCAELSGTKHD